MSADTLAYVILQGTYEQEGVRAVALDRVAAEREAQSVHEGMNPPRRHPWKANSPLDALWDFAECARDYLRDRDDKCEVAIQVVRLVP